MGMGKRLGLALTVVALLAGLVTHPQLPADAAGQAAFQHVFGDGDNIPRSVYSIPDDFTFTNGAYVLAITASVIDGTGPQPPTVTGKGLTWNLRATKEYPSLNGQTTLIAIFDAWADGPSGATEDDMTFDFGSQTLVRHVRSFEESTGIDRTTNPIAQFAWDNGTNATSGNVQLSPFWDPVNSSTVFAVFKHRSGAFSSTSLSLLGDTNVGAPVTGSDPLRLLTAYSGGEALNPSATWSTASVWHAVGIEIVSDGDPPSTTTTTGPTTSTTAATTTTTQPTTTTTTASTTTTTQAATTSTAPSTTTTTQPATPTTTVDPGSSTTTTVVETPPTTVVETPPQSGRFTDDDGSVFEADIERIAEAEITLGCNPPDNDRYCPDDTLTRGQMAAFLARALGLDGTPADRFVDDDVSVFAREIGLIAQAGITAGCNPPENDRFCPEDTLTRGQMAAFLARALGLDGTPADRFVDDTTSVFETDIDRIAAIEIALGCNPPANDRFCPDDTVTRGQMAAFLNRMLDYRATS